MLEDSFLDQNGEYQGYKVSVRLVREGQRDYMPLRLTNSESVYQFLLPLRDLDREVFYCLHLDARNQLLSCEEVSRGTLSGALVHPREVYKAAILSSAAAIIIAHNHPSGSAMPSAEDLQVTDRIKSAGDVLGIQCLDSIVLGDKGYRSLLGCNRK